MHRLWLLSDLHFENWPIEKRYLPAPDCDIVVVAGDVWESNPEMMIDGLFRLSEGRPVVCVMGNHDLWGLEIDEALERARERAASHSIHVLQDDEVELQGIRFFGSTWWPDLQCETNALSPFGEPLLRGGRVIIQRDIDLLRKHTLAAAALSTADVFVTHYGPEILNEWMPRLWISGHIHSFDRRIEGKTEFVRNPRQSRVFADRMVLDLPVVPPPVPL